MNEGLVVLVRGLIAFFTLLIYTRILGKQQVSQLTFFDYIMGITIGSTASSMTVDLTSRAWPHFVGLTVWFVAVFIFQVAVVKSKKLSNYIDGQPTIVILNGQIMDNAMRKMRVRLSDLLEMLREKGAFDISEVEFAVLENNGRLSVLKKSEYLPLTPKDMKIKTNYKGPNTELIYDGKVLEESLKEKHLTKSWLIEQLNKQNVKDVSEVFYATMNSSGQIYIDKYKDKIGEKKSDIYENLTEKGQK